MNTTLTLTALSLFIILGVFMGFILSFFFILKKSPNSKANRFQGLLLLTLSLCIFEQFLNMTGFIVRVLFVTNTTEPLNLVIGPFLYLFVKRSIDPQDTRKELIHFILPVLYLGYMILDYVQTNEFKYNSYINSYHPDWPLLAYTRKIVSDPLKLKGYLNLVTAVQIFLYTTLSIRLLIRKATQSGSTILKTDDEVLKSLRNMVVHIIIIVVIFITVKLNFRADLGDYFIGLYISFFALLTTIRVMNDSSYFDKNGSFIDISVSKYRKSSLTENDKMRILSGIENEFESKNYFEDNLASLSDLAKKLGESPHHVSQVINEKLNCNFFELLARYRIEKAKKIFSEDLKNKLTVEEVSEMVGYNSRTAFNNAFRKITGKTPSEFRNS